MVSGGAYPRPAIGFIPGEPSSRGGRLFGKSAANPECGISLFRIAQVLFWLGYFQRRKLSNAMLINQSVQGRLLSL